MFKAADHEFEVVPSLNYFVLKGAADNNLEDYIRGCDRIRLRLSRRNAAFDFRSVFSIHCNVRLRQFRGCFLKKYD